MFRKEMWYLYLMQKKLRKWRVTFKLLQMDVLSECTRSQKWLIFKWSCDSHKLRKKSFPDRQSHCQFITVTVSFFFFVNFFLTFFIAFEIRITDTHTITFITIRTTPHKCCFVCLNKIKIVMCEKKKEMMMNFKW